MTARGLFHPPRSSHSYKTSQKKRSSNAPAGNPRIDESKPISTKVSSGSGAPNRKDVQARSKTTGKATSGRRPSSSRTHEGNTVKSNNESRAQTEFDINKTCSQNHGLKIFQIYWDIVSHRQGTLSITSYFTRLKTFWCSKTTGKATSSRTFARNPVQHNNGSRAQTGSEINQTCSQNHGLKVFQTYWDIAFHCQGTLSITSFFTRLKTFWCSKTTGKANGTSRTSSSRTFARNPVQDNNGNRAQTGSDINKTNQNDSLKVFQIYWYIASHRQGTLSITSYFTRLKTFWDELATYSDLPLCSCGEMSKLSKHKEREKLMQFLMGLNESYSTLREGILLMEPFPTVEIAYSIILGEEKRRKIIVSSDFSSTRCNVDEVHGTLPHEYNNHQKLENQKATDTSLLANKYGPHHLHGSLERSTPRPSLDDLLGAGPTSNGYRSSGGYGHADRLGSHAPMEWREPQTQNDDLWEKPKNTVRRSKLNLHSSVETGATGKPAAKANPFGFFSLLSGVGETQILEQT